MRTRAAALGLFLLIIPAYAQEAAKPDPLAQEAYVMPPREIADAVLAPWWQNHTPSNFSPDGKYYVVSEREGLTPLALLARPHSNFAGIDVDTTANRARRLTTRSASSLRIHVVGTDEIQRVTIPNGASVSDPTWSPDGTKLAYQVHLPNKTEAWVYELASKRSRRVASNPLLATLVTSVEWIDGDRLVAVVVPNNRPAAPAFPEVAQTPKVAVSDPKKVSLRTWASLMGSPVQFDQLEYYTTGQLALIDTKNGRVNPVGKPAMIQSVSANRDGKAFRVSLLRRPFSYMFPSSSFPTSDVIWDDTGTQRVELGKTELPTAARPESRPNEKRGYDWHPKGLGLVYLQFEPERPAGQNGTNPTPPEQQRRPGGAGQAPAAPEVRGKDRLMLWKAPFGEKDVEELYVSDERIGSVQWSADGALMIVRQGTGRTAKILAMRPGTDVPPVSLEAAGSTEEPLRLITRAGRVRVSSDSKWVYVDGTQYGRDSFKEAPRPFLERVSLETGKRERLFQSKADVYEDVTLVDDNGKLMVTRQSPTQIANSFLVVDGQEKKLTDNKDFLPDLTQARRERVLVTRPDGIKFWVKVTLPSSFVEGSKPPAFFWFYPSEFTDQAAYDRGFRTFNKNAFNGISPSNKAILLRRGYALIEPDCPIIGDAARKNDGYIPQLRNNLSATIDELDRRGFIDRQRLGLGGHSYGAFSTANAMVHTPFFKAGIAGDGNFNRLLTPFGFQSETRPLWESREVYLGMSPLLFAEQITGALLLYHGIEDQNMGTDPINSEKMFAALQSLGKPASMYMYPYEDHGQIAQETILDQWARWVAWLDKYVKGN